MVEKWRYETAFGSVRLENSDEIVAMPFAAFKAQEIRDRRGRLIAAAPEMYNWLKVFVQIFADNPSINISCIQKLLADIDGENNRKEL